MLFRKTCFRIRRVTRCFANKIAPVARPLSRKRGLGAPIHVEMPSDTFDICYFTLSISTGTFIIHMHSFDRTILCVRKRPSHIRTHPCASICLHHAFKCILMSMLNLSFWSESKKQTTTENMCKDLEIVIMLGAEDS